MSVAVASLHSTTSFVPPFDEAVSAAAIELRGDIDVALAPQTSITVGRVHELAQKLLRAMSKAATRDGVHVSTEAYDRAFAVMWALPNTVPTPDVVIEPDGEIAFDWDEGPRRVLSISIGDGPMLRYATLIGAEPAHGRMVFAGVLPGTLSFLLRRVYPEHAGTHNTW